MEKTRDLFKKIRDTKGTFHAKMGSIKDRNGMDLTEAEDIKKRWGGGTKMAEEQDGENTFSPTNSSKAFKRRVNSTKQLLNAGRGHQAPRKATQLFERREKKYSSIHQNIDTSFPNQETVTSHLYKPTHSEETPQ